MDEKGLQEQRRLNLRKLHEDKKSQEETLNEVKKSRGRPRIYAPGEAQKRALEKYCKAHPEKSLLAAAKSRAKKSGLEFDITEEDVVIPKSCPVFGIEISFRVENARSPNSMTLDRIDITKGYVKGNVQVISSLANIMKVHATPDKLIAFAEWVLKTYKK